MSVTCIMSWFSPRWQLSSSAPRHMNVPCVFVCVDMSQIGCCLRTSINSSDRCGGSPCSTWGHWSCPQSQGSSPGRRSGRPRLEDVCESEGMGDHLVEILGLWIYMGIRPPWRPSIDRWIRGHLRMADDARVRMVPRVWSAERGVRRPAASARLCLWGGRSMEGMMDQSVSGRWRGSV